ncbi:23S ribosomal RNA methyltransferase Erm [Thermobifida halotolerans]|uniref:23S ribosomal RNA methyltransferase Erm n=1 Tax=Thermobifida halotolerans TaxID=483545 RepID=A0AA97M374_9ACTN|nr:23S ribosomal RNA methyltransferase Erm [Thermobifida halotolerans]UOE18671.1 23S ribosomal RNA methyltransferase Erm [Thermobifida halotolerans]
MSHSRHGGRHELGQNFLVDRAVIADIHHLVSAIRGPIVEIAAGDGALTLPLSRLGRPLTAVELDPRRARRLRRRVADGVTVVNDDLLRFRLPRVPHVVVGNIPFHLTTAALRRLLAVPHWHTAILVTQWEAARRRAGIGGASLLTASWWPWYEFTVHARIPARSFRPVPSVDGGLLSVTRRPEPLVADRRRYQRFVAQVFTGPGRGLAEILARTGRIPRPALRDWLCAHRVAPRALPKDLTARQWAALWTLVETGGGPGAPTPRRRGLTGRGRHGDIKEC